MPITELIHVDNLFLSLLYLSFLMKNSSLSSSFIKKNKLPNIDENENNYLCIQKLVSY